MKFKKLKFQPTFIEDGVWEYEGERFDDEGMRRHLKGSRMGVTCPRIAKEEVLQKQGWKSVAEWMLWHNFGRNDWVEVSRC